jgi:hypothetical protein
VSKKKMMKSRPVNEGDILKRLSAGLSEEEIRRILAGALNSLDQAGVDRLLQRVGSETGTALRRVLDADNSKCPLVPGRAKIKEEWEQAWEDWDSRIAEASDSEGDYVIQEHHWEEPYFDPQSVTHDLEPIAARMRKLLPRVFDENIDPDFSFAQAVQEGIEEIESGLPDWMDPFANEGFGLGPEVTACLIDWEWRSARRRGMTAFQFVDQLCQLEASTQGLGLGLDERVVARFIRGLGADAKNDVLKGIQAKRDQKPWKQALDSAHSSWFRIYKELCRSQDRPAYLENCRVRISQDWTLALPVAKDLERRKKHAEILALCAAALRSFLYLREGERWELREELLVARAGYRLNGQLDARLPDLLQIWGRSARALEEEEIAAAARLQSDLLEEWRNWDKAIAAFHRIPQPRFAPLRERLFAQWRELVAERSVGSVLYGLYGDLPQKPHWVHALADAAWEGEGSQDSFCAWLRQWLNTTERDCATLRRSQGALARLSLDLDSAAWLSSVSPTMARVLAYNQSNDPALGASRRTWLERLGAYSLVPELLAFWRRNAQHLVPDPAASGGTDYLSCADWAQALRELNPTSCKELLRQWSVAHHRRRNLWRALQTKGLSMSAGNGE